MFKIQCRCGKTQKSFKFNIGPFFINKCCKKEGYDNFGNLTTTESVDVDTSEQIVDAPKEVVAVETAEVKVGQREQLAKNTLKELKAIGRERKIKGCNRMSKEKLLDALVGKE